MIIPVMRVRNDIEILQFVLLSHRLWINPTKTDDYMAPQRRLMSTHQSTLSATSELYRNGKGSANLMLTWNSLGMDMIEAVTVDGVVDVCSVNNSQWRAKPEKNNLKFATCGRSCGESDGLGLAVNVL